MFRSICGTFVHNKLLINGRRCNSSDWRAVAEEIVQHKREPQNGPTYTEFREVDVDWNYIERLLPREFVPEMPSKGPFPSGWVPPKDPVPKLPFYIGRNKNHMPELYLERRRDLLNPKTMDFEYVELVTLRNIHGDIFACEDELREYLETKLGHPVATHVDELKGLIKVKGADRSLLEKFVYSIGF